MNEIQLTDHLVAHIGAPDSTCKCNGWFRVGLF